MELSRIHHEIEHGTPQVAAAYLQDWLDPGPPVWYQRWQHVQRQIMSLPRQEMQRRFIDSLSDFAQMPDVVVAYLDHVYSAQQYADEADWAAAAQAYQMGLNLHQSSFRLTHHQLQQQYDFCQQALRMHDLIERGNDAYTLKDWARASEAFQQADSLNQNGMGISPADIADVIDRCRRGLAYEKAVAQARQAATTDDVKTAIETYRKALRLYHPDCQPLAEIVQEELNRVEPLAAVRRDRNAVILDTRNLWAGLVLLGLGLGWTFWSKTNQSQPVPRSRDTVRLIHTVPAPSSASAEPNVPSLSDLQWDEPFDQPQPGAGPIAGSFQETTTESPGPTAPSQPGSAPRAIAPSEASPPEKLATEAKAAPATPVPQKATPLAEVASPILTIDSAAAAPVPPPDTKHQVEKSADPSPSKTRAEPLSIAEQMPSFPGGEVAMSTFVRQHMQYPELARENEVEGTVYLQMVVQPNGNLTDLRVARGVGFGCDQEALRVVQQMPDWQPGQQAGQAVPVRYTLPIVFRIP